MAEPEIQEIDLTQVTGYSPEDRYLATRYTQGDRKVFDFELPLNAIPQIFPVPDPDRPTLGNRRVNPAHAKDFAKYVRENADWVAPALLMRAPDVFAFDVNTNVSGVSFGILGVPRSARSDVRIIDGQHRILGLAYAVADVAQELDEARQAMAAAHRDDNAELAGHYKKEIDKLELQRRRLASEFIAVQVHVETDQERFEQMFYDVADNALGISGAVKVRFDSRKVMNRALDAVLKHSLLKGRVDLEQDRITGGNPHFLGAKHVVDIVRTANIGIAGRVSRRQESEMVEGALVQRADDFFDVLLDSFPPLASVADETMTPEELRKTSLLGSSTILRILAGVFYELGAQGYSDEEIGEFFAVLAPHMGAPIGQTSPWLRIRTKVFVEGAMAPTARAQDLKGLTSEIAEWIDETYRPQWLSAAGSAAAPEGE